MLKHFNHKILKLITFDHRIKFTRCSELEDQFNTSIAFAHSNSSWERGQNENDNGMNRRWYPKGTNFNCISQKALNEVTWQSHDMPRDILGWRSTIEVFNEFMKINGYKMYN